jgi:hypothetical protein
MKTPHKNYSVFFLFIGLCAFISGCSSNPSPSDGKQAIQNQITQDAQGRIKLIEFHKINGQLAEINAIKVYSLEFEAEIEFTEDCKWVVGRFGENLSFITSKLINTPSSGFDWNKFLDDTSVHPGTAIKQGHQENISGVIRFEKKENGWSVDGIEITKAKPVANSTDSSLEATKPVKPQQDLVTQTKAAQNHAGLTTQDIPKADEIKQWIDTRISQQSHGLAKLVDFKLNSHPWTNSSEAVRVTIAVEFLQPCKWIFSSEEHTFQFKTVMPTDPDSNIQADNKNIVKVAQANAQYHLYCDLLFEKKTSWNLVGIRPLIGPIGIISIFEEGRIGCVNNLKQIGLAFRIWAANNGSKFPFNITTNFNTSINTGGTMEFCSIGSDGFDANSYLHFQVMSNELGIFCSLLICPSDSSKKPAATYRFLSSSNVSYQIRSGPNVSDANPKEILARCPIHGTILYCDGSVSTGQ